MTVLNSDRLAQSLVCLAGIARQREVNLLKWVQLLFLDHSLVNSSVGINIHCEKSQSSTPTTTSKAHLNSHEMRRSCVMLGRARSLLVTSRQRVHGNTRLVIPTRLARTKLPRDTSDPNSPARQSSGVHTRSSNAQKSAQDAEQSPIQLDADSPPHPDGPPIPPSEPEKPPRRTKTSASSTSNASTQRDRESDPDDRPQLPQGLDILWLPHDLPSLDSQRNNILPPPELFDDALTNLHIALHPHTQHRAAYVTATGLPIEPTLALYCPVEGGEYVLDETVRELARRTGAEVLVIDAVQLAAGEWGHFGKGKSSSHLISSYALKHTYSRQCNPTSSEPSALPPTTTTHPCIPPSISEWRRRRH